MSARVLALFAKQPVPGRVKTRLAPPFSLEQAASLYEAMLADILDQHSEMDGWDRVVWHEPAAAADWFRRVIPRGYRLLPQRGADLAERMRNLFRTHAAEGYQRIVLRGTDSPTLPLERVAEAFRALDENDLVLCPDRDGGYNLIGLSTPQDALFELEMSTASVLEQTLALVRDRELRCEMLPAHHDVDTASDLELLEPELSEALTPRTLRWLRDARS
ncbi:MAG: TIGR04282 family arsenosugar biosynthesis glycosyltransferase [Myxococcota bacterium]